MLSITIPLWLLLTSAGLPTLLLLMLIVRLIRAKRKKKSIASTRFQPIVALSRSPEFNDQIHQELLEQQIDAVFNVLAAVMEAEHIKLKVLAGHTLPSVPVGQRLPSDTGLHYDAPSDDDGRHLRQSAPSLGQSIITMAKEGMTPPQIARRLGLSRAEVDLALKMNNSLKNKVGTKMKAVA